MTHPLPGGAAFEEVVAGDVGVGLIASGDINEKGFSRNH
jgi:hypothetical protein